MYAALWSAIGILAAGLFSTIYYFNLRMDAGFGRLEARIDRLESRMDQGFARLEGRLDAHIERHAG